MPPVSNAYDVHAELTRLIRDFAAELCERARAVRARPAGTTGVGAAGAEFARSVEELKAVALVLARHAAALEAEIRRQAGKA